MSHLACVGERLSAGGMSQLIVGVDRRVRLVLGDESAPDLALALELTDGSTSLADAARADPAGESDLLVGMDLDTALRIGSGAALVDEEYAAGRVWVRNASAADLRLAPALELLLEALAGCALLAPGGAR